MGGLAIDPNTTAVLAGSSPSSGRSSARPLLGIFAAGELMLDAGASVTAGPDVVGVILDTTSFYATMGGQVSDLGTISASGASDDEESTMTFTVAEAKVFGGFVLHQGGVDSGTVTIGDKVTSLVNYSYRGMIAPNHTMTHVASLALRTHYAADVAQKGSLCDAQKIRFDFAGRSGLTMEQLEACQKMCQDQIAAALPVHVKELCSPPLLELWGYFFLPSVVHTPQQLH
jgi:alanyl-tRNA synthetase